MKHLRTLFALLLAVLLLAGCGAKQEAQPITLTIWHVYGAQTDSPLNDMIDVFNQTVGKEQGICVQVTSVTNNRTIHEGILAAANGDPGAAQLPDMFISYPKTVLAMPDESVLVDYNDYFSPQERAAFVPSFLEEGIVHDRQVILPVAKSTEMMFINKTMFDRFAADTGAKLEDLSTWEGLYDMASRYAQWSGGKTFFVHDFHFNYAQVGVESLGRHFFDDDGIVFDDTFAKMWAPYAKAAIEGGVWLNSGYATEPHRTGDAVVSVASSASILYYSNVVTYPNNVSEEVEFLTAPCPVFRDGENLVMQRGAGICTVKSTPEREAAAMTFLKWLTEPERNVELVTKLGYMPVTTQAFEEYLPQAIAGITELKYQKLYETFMETQQNYEFYVPPQRDDYLRLETDFENQARLLLAAAANDYRSGGDSAQLSQQALQALQEFYGR